MGRASFCETHHSTGVDGFRYAFFWSLRAYEAGVPFYPSCINVKLILHRYLKDADATLQKGVRLWSDKQENPVPTIDDIGHTMANALNLSLRKGPFISVLPH